MLQLHKPPKCPRRKCGQEWVLSENKQSKTWTSHSVILLDEMRGVASDALENRRRNLLSEATAELQKQHRQSHEQLQEYRQRVQRHLSEVWQEVQIQQVASGEEVDISRHELSQSLPAGPHYQYLYATSRSGVFENSSEIQQLRHERDHLINVETWKPKRGDIEAQLVFLKRKMHKFLD